jgi:nitroreductase
VETWDAFRSRRAVRNFTDAPIPPEILDRILDAGRRSPSGSNRQQWDFVVCTERATLQALAGTYSAATWVARAPAVVVFVSPTAEERVMREYIQFDHGQAAMAMMLIAADLGIGSAHAGAMNQKAFREILGLPEDRFCRIMLAFGYPADEPLRPLEKLNRRPFDDVVHRERW